MPFKKIYHVWLIIVTSGCTFAQNDQTSTTSIDTSLVNINTFSKNILTDLKYATTSNFLNQKLYPCNTCLLRQEVALWLSKANIEFLKLGYTLKVLDCYRPLSVQYKMWEIVPNEKYVANPKKGSVHNKGAAVDITLVRVSNGKELDMGTAFDFFGIQASHDYKSFSIEILNNRNLLKTIMEKHHFKSYRAEWWHYTFVASKKYSHSNYQWQCN